MKKLLCLFLLVSGALFAQTPAAASWYRINGNYPQQHTQQEIAEIRQASPNATIVKVKAPASASQSVVSRRAEVAQATSQAPVIIGSLLTYFAPVDTLISPFYSYFSGGEAAYNLLSQPNSAAAVRPDLTTVQPVSPPDPQMIFLDGYGAGLIAVDIATLSVSSQVPVPSMVGPFGIRPSAAGPPNEVWVLNSGVEVPAGAEISVVDLSTQTLVANIPLPSIPQSASSRGIVFTNDGATAFVAYDGFLVTLNAAGRAVTSTIPLKYSPTALLMAPDGSTLYILSPAAFNNNNGVLTYYDILSGTADLSVSTSPPAYTATYFGFDASEFGYNDVSPVFIHPDGTRLFWHLQHYLVVFDLTARQITNVFDSGLTGQTTFSLSQDGSTAYFSDGEGDVNLADTYHGTVLESFTLGSSTALVWSAPPVAP